jgi:hypothetical protein
VDDAGCAGPLAPGQAATAIEDAVVLAARADDLAAYRRAGLPRTTTTVRPAVKAARPNPMAGHAGIAVRNTVTVALSQAVPSPCPKGCAGIADRRPPQAPYAAGKAPAGNHQRRTPREGRLHRTR